MNIRERPPLRLHDEIITPSGRRYRWGMDEPDPANVPSRRRDSSTLPGGFESGDATLPRKPGIDYSDLVRLSTHRRYGAGGEVAYEGRLERAPVVSGDQFSISPSSVGWQAHLEDDKSVQVVYIDRDLNRWRETSRDRRLALLNAGVFQPQDAFVTADTGSGTPALAMEVDGEWTTSGRPICEAIYDAGPNVGIGFIRFSWQRASSTTSSDWIWRLISAAGDDNSSLNVGEATSDLQNEPNATGSSAFTPSASRRYMMLQLFWNAAVASNSPGVKSAVYWYDLAVVGDHNLAERGTAPETGLYDADIIGHALSTWCPLLNYTTESLAASPFVIQQLAFNDPTTVGEIVRQATRFSVRPWAVWEDKTFWLYDWGSKGRSWRARVGPSQLEETGPQADRLWNGILVQFQDVDGSTRTTGPVGSGADAESSELLDTDPNNPANQLGIRRWDMLVMGTGTTATATEVGRRFLEESKRLDTSGRAVFNGYVEDDRGVVHPYWKVRPGDDVVFVDAADTSARRIVKADHDHDARSCSVDLDSPPEGLQALLERLSVVLVPLGL